MNNGRQRQTTADNGDKGGGALVDALASNVAGIFFGVIYGPISIGQSMLSIWLLFGILTLFRGGVLIWFNGWGHWRLVLKMSIVLVITTSLLATALTWSLHGGSNSPPPGSGAFAAAWLTSNITTTLLLYKYTRLLGS